jgi:F-box protein 21
MGNQEAIHFDKLIRLFREQHPDEHARSTRARALLLLRFVRQSNVLWDRLGFRRINDERGNDYFQLIARPNPAHLEDEQSPAPLQTSRFIASPDPYLVVLEVVIFCVLAQRLGIDARPLNIVLRFRAAVYPPEGRDLDDRLLAAGRVGEPMYLDPRSTSDERPRAEMEKILRGYHHIVPAAARTLEPRPVPQFLAVAAIRAVLGSHDHWRQHTIAPQLWSAFWCRSQHRGLLDRHYAALWAAVTLCRPDDLYLGLTGLEPNHVLSSLVAMLQTRFPEDALLIEDRAEPLFRGSAQHHNMMRSMHHAEDDAEPKPVHRRTDAVNGRVKYRVGQVFQHRRYDYLAVIIGWDTTCEMDEEWVQQMNVDSLDHGRRQSFYHAMYVSFLFPWPFPLIPSSEREKWCYKFVS